MNKLNYFFKILFLFFVSNGVTIAQADLTQGVIKMEMTDVDSDNQQIAAQLEMMKGTETAYHFNSEKSLVTADMMGGMIKMQTLFNNADEHLTLFFDMMGQKIMVESTKEERDEGKEENAMDDFEVTYDETDTKEILGYKCIKAVIKGKAESPMSFQMYLSRDIKASNKMIQGLDAFELDGFPLEYILEMENMSMTNTAIELSQELDEKVFDVSSDGFKKMTLKEFQEQMGAMGGGMGF